MSDISIPGVSSKYNTTKLIEDLVDAERIRLTGMENRSDTLNESRSAWRQVSRDLGDLQRAMKGLYGFENPFSEKNASSSNERILTAIATRSAPFEKYSITVKQLATADRFLTPSIDRSFRVQSGKYTFSVGDQSVTLRYRGGTVEDFARRLTDRGKGIVSAAAVRDTRDTQVLMIEAIPTGAENRLRFEDDSRDLVFSMGMMKGTKTDQGLVIPNNIASSLTTAGGESVPEKSIKIGEDSFLVYPGKSLRIPLDEIKIEDNMVLEYSYRTVEYSNEEIAAQTPPGPLWPDVSGGTYEGLRVRGAKNTLELPGEGSSRPQKRVDDWKVLQAEGSDKSVDLPPISLSTESTRVNVPIANLPDGFSALILENDNTHRGVEIQNIQIYDPSTVGGLEPTQAADIAGDAVIDFRGIEARRPSNDIDDLVDGLTLNLKRASPEPVEISVEPDSEAAKEKIIRFVFSYNQLLTQILVLTSDDQSIIDELEYLDDNQREEMENQLGIFRGDITLNQVKSRIQGVALDAYPTSAGPELALLAQIGVSTNASSGSVGGALDFSKLRGYLEIDEEKLDVFLQKNIDAVKDLFGNDTTGDLVIDSGIARELDKYLTPYTQSGGFISNRISGIDGQIENAEEEITDYEEYLEEYETELKREYGRMEAVLNQLENSSKDLDNFNQQQNNRR